MVHMVNIFLKLNRGFSDEDLVSYISYNPKYKIRYRIVNGVPAGIECFVAESCGRLGFILWRVNAIGGKQ